MFEACLTLPQGPHEARLLADNLDALAHALRDWPDEAWRKVTTQPDEESGSLFERLVARTAPTALVPRKRAQAMQSAAAVADVLRVLWPEQTAAPAEAAVAQAA
jgi:hypothetical protein